MFVEFGTNTLDGFSLDLVHCDSETEVDAVAYRFYFYSSAVFGDVNSCSACSMIWSYRDHGFFVDQSQIDIVFEVCVVHRYVDIQGRSLEVDVFSRGSVSYLVDDVLTFLVVDDERVKGNWRTVSQMSFAANVVVQHCRGTDNEVASELRVVQVD